MKERSITLKPWEVRAILDGRKTVKRWVVKLNESGRIARGGRQWHIDDPAAVQACPYGQPGDRLWVRERAAFYWGGWHYLADGPSEWGPDVSERTFSRPSTHMPRVASRITLEVTGVRVERLHDLSEEDAIQEGIRELPLQENEPGAWWCADPLGNSSLRYQTPRAAFARLLDHINGAGSWDANPWVWVVEFKRKGGA